MKPIRRLVEGRVDFVVTKNAIYENWQRHPTGHGIIFIGAGGRFTCYVAPGGA